MSVISNPLEPQVQGGMPRQLDAQVDEAKITNLKKLLKKSDTICAAISLFGLTLAYIEVR